MSILGTVGGMIAGIPEIVSGVASIVDLFDGGDGGPTRADWAQLEYQRQLTAAMTPVSTGMLPGPAYTAAPIAALPVSTGAAISMAPTAMPQVGNGVGLTVAKSYMKGKYTVEQFWERVYGVKDLISAEWMGYSAGELRKIAREKGINYEFFSMVTRNPELMNTIWKAMGGIWAAQDHQSNQFRQHVLERLDNALQDMKKKKRRRGRPSFKTIYRSFRAWKSIEKAARKAGALKSPRRSQPSRTSYARGGKTDGITVVNTD